MPTLTPVQPPQLVGQYVGQTRPSKISSTSQERHYVMVASVSERRLEVEGDTASSVQSRAQHAPDGHDRHDPPPSGHAHGRAVSGTVNGHAHCAGCQQKARLVWRALQNGGV